MPLEGQAKTDYQREYMRERRQQPEKDEESDIRPDIDPNIYATPQGLLEILCRQILAVEKSKKEIIAKSKCISTLCRTAISILEEIRAEKRQVLEEQAVQDIKDRIIGQLKNIDDPAINELAEKIQELDDNG